MSEDKAKAVSTVGIRFMRLPEVCKAVGVGQSTVWELVRHGEFPLPIKVTSRCTAWRSDEVEAWMASRNRVEIRMEDEQ